MYQKEELQQSLNYALKDVKDAINRAAGAYTSIYEVAKLLEKESQAQFLKKIALRYFNFEDMNKVVFALEKIKRELKQVNTVE